MTAYDWRDLAAVTTDPATVHKPTEIQREILRLHRRCLQPRDLATPFGLDDAAVLALIHGTDTAGTV